MRRCSRKAWRTLPGQLLHGLEDQRQLLPGAEDVLRRCAAGIEVPGFAIRGMVALAVEELQVQLAPSQLVHGQVGGHLEQEGAGHCRESPGTPAGAGAKRLPGRPRRRPRDCPACAPGSAPGRCPGSQPGAPETGFFLLAAKVMVQPPPLRRNCQNSTRLRIVPSMLANCSRATSEYSASTSMTT